MASLADEQEIVLILYLQQNGSNIKLLTGDICC